jgi:DNA-binding LytR/AlgR family response regulator
LYVSNISEIAPGQRTGKRASLRHRGSAPSRTSFTSRSRAPDLGLSSLSRDPPGSTPDLLIGERDHRFYVLKRANVEYIAAHGNYVKLNAGGVEYIKRDSVKELEVALAASGFVRIERSLLINLGAVLYVQRAGRGVFAFTFPSGGCVRSGPSYRELILQVLPLTKSSRRTRGSPRQSPPA